MARDYAAEHARREELAHERGFESASAERAYREETKYEREIAGTSAEWEKHHPHEDWRSANPETLALFYETVLEPASRGDATGSEKHDAVSYFMDYEGMTQEEAVDAMKEAFGYE